MRINNFPLALSYEIKLNSKPSVELHIKDLHDCELLKIEPSGNMSQHYDEKIPKRLTSISLPLLGRVYFINQLSNKVESY